LKPKSLARCGTAPRPSLSGTYTPGRVLQHSHVRLQTRDRRRAVCSSAFTHTQHHLSVGKSKRRTSTTHELLVPNNTNDRGRRAETENGTQTRNAGAYGTCRLRRLQDYGSPGPWHMQSVCGSRFLKPATRRIAALFQKQGNQGVHARCM
jgi:hypothetical protein